MRMLGLAAVAVVSLLVAREAAAIEREGFFFGLGVGVGSISCDGCESLTGPAVELHLGEMLSDRLALVLDGSAVSKTENGNTLYSFVSTGCVQYWAAPKVWLKGGIGLGELQLQLGRATLTSESGLGFTAAIGVETLQRRRFVLDLQFRYSTAKIEGDRINNVSGIVGFNWY